jgi:Sec-independent protein secretion pathway component TatC
MNKLLLFLVGIVFAYYYGYIVLPSLFDHYFGSREKSDNSYFDSLPTERQRR